MSFRLPRIYPITDRRLAGISHVEQVRLLARAGARLIQVREKTMPSGDLLREASEAVRTARELGARIIINDRADIALMSGAAGVHLGQTDLPPAAARRLLGEHAVIGYSTHNEAQAFEAAKLPIDYVAIGPVFATATKNDAEPVLGPAGVEAVRRAIGEVPLVAIGGIDKQNAVEAFRAGADSVAVISAILCQGGDIPASYLSFLAEVNKRL